jgi:hypothetical protein
VEVWNGYGGGGGDDGHDDDGNPKRGCILGDDDVRAAGVPAGALFAECRWWWVGRGREGYVESGLSPEI